MMVNTRRDTLLYSYQFCSILELTLDKMECYPKSCDPIQAHSTPRFIISFIYHENWILVNCRECFHLNDGIFFNFRHSYIVLFIFESSPFQTAHKNDQTTGMFHYKAKPEQGSEWN